MASWRPFTHLVGAHEAHFETFFLKVVLQPHTDIVELNQECFNSPQRAKLKCYS